jgi:endonuclease/exonuclease/phosphatase family metal-dependent hydrolase
VCNSGKIANCGNKPVTIALLPIAAALAANLSLQPAPTSDLSVMSYNVHGLPWPIAKERAPALRAIGERLAAMRRDGDQPHLVLLQEAFTSDAKSIARESGYPYVVTGPNRRDRVAATTPADAKQFTRADDRFKGEGDGTLEDSGLLVLSDYPVLQVKRMPYARYTCAGFDCLANKGMVLVQVAVPGVAQPVAVIDTHMNSRGSSGVRLARADAAYGRQAEQLRAFVGANVPAATPAIVAGDFNIGKAGYRRAMITGGGGVLPGATDALRTALGEGLKLRDQAAAQEIVTRDKDWMFARGGHCTLLDLQSVAVPFAREPNGKSLSDHFGYVAHYAIENAPAVCG